MGGRDSYYTSRAAVIIDNSGSTAMEDTGMTDKKTGHQLNRLDRHVLTAATYLGAFPDSGEYRIITPMAIGSRGIQSKDFDNTADAINYLFTLTPSGGGFADFPSDRILKLTSDYGNVLVIIDEELNMIAPKTRMTVKEWTEYSRANRI